MTTIKIERNLHKYVISGLMLCSLLIAGYVRLIGVSDDFTSLVGADSARYVHQAQQILEHGRMPAVDMLRVAPIGQSTSTQLTLYPYVIAALYRVAQIVHIDIEQFVTILPVLLFLLTVLPIYLLTWRIFGHAVALLSVNILVLTPHLLARTYGGFTDRDGFVLLLSMWSFFFYVQSYLEEDYKQWLHRGLSSGIMLCLGLTWQGVGIFSAIIVTVELLKIITDDSYDWKSARLFAVWTLPILVSLLVFKPQIYSHLRQPYAFIAIVYSGIGLFAALLVSIIQRMPVLKKPLSFNHRLPIGFSTIALVGIFSFSLRYNWVFDALIPSLTQPYGDDPLFELIGELQKLGAAGWTEWPGVFYIPMAIGLLCIAYAVCDSLHLHKHWTLGFLQIIIFGIALSRLASGQSQANSIETPFTLGSYSISMGIGAIGLVIVLVHAYLKRDSQTPLSIDKTVWINVFLIVWCLGMLVAMRAAVRFVYLFAIPSTILGSYALLLPFKRWLSPEKWNRLYSLYGVCLLWQAYILFADSVENVSVFIAIYVLLGCITISVVWLITRALKQATLKRQFALTGIAVYLIVLTALSPHLFLGGGYAFHIRHGLPVLLLAEDSGVKKAFAWIRENTETDAVIAAHWEYGSWLNLLSDRATIVDEQQPGNWTNVMAKEVFVANNDIQGALEFLKTHQADYLLLTHRNIKYIEHICREASITNYIGIPVFGNVIQEVQVEDKETGTVQTYYRYWLPKWQSAMGGYNLTVDGKTYPADNWYISSVYIQTETFEDMVTPTKALVELNLNGSVEYLPPEYLRYGDTVLSADTQSPFLPCTMVIDGAGHAEPTRWHIVYLSPDIRSSLLVRLFLFNELSEVFEQVYPNSETLEDFAAQVWKIHYPDNIETKPEYLQIDTLASTNF